MGDIAERDASDAAVFAVRVRAQDHVEDLIRGVEVTLGAHDVGALSLLDVAAGDGGVFRAQPIDHVADSQAELGELLGRHDDAHLALGLAEDVDAGNARDALDPFLDDIFEEVAIGDEIPVVSLLASQYEPGDRVVVGARGAQRRLVGFLRVSRHPVEPVRNQQQRAVHVLAWREFERDIGAPGARAALDGAHALDPLEDLLLAIDDLALDLQR